MKSLLFLLPFVFVAQACNLNREKSDAFGNFTATEIIVSSEVPGKIVAKYAMEGDRVEAAKIIYQVDTVQTFLKLKEAQARRKSIAAKRSEIQAQIAVLEEQKKALNSDLKRFKGMLSDGAVSEKQIDDIENQLTILQKQIDQVRTSYSSLTAENEALSASLSQIRDMISRASAKAPIKGTIVETYAENGENVATGKPLFKLVNMDELELKAYFSANQLSGIKLNDKVNVYVDDGSDGLKSYTGKITWIASDAEFTPKIIQTREERVSLVYAVKIRVENDGYLKINMPGEVKLINAGE